MRPHAISRARRARDSQGGGGGCRGSNGVIGRTGQIPVARHWSASVVVIQLPSGLDRPASGHRRPFPHIRSAILKTSQPRMAIPTPRKSMTETTASSYFLHGTYGLRRRMASNKLFVRLSGEVVGPLALRQGHLYAAGPSVGACFFRTIFCAFAPCPATKAPALPHSEAGASPFVRTGVVMMQLLRLRRDLSLRAISAAWPSKATSASAASRSG